MPVSPIPYTDPGTALNPDAADPNTYPADVLGMPVRAALVAMAAVRPGVTRNQAHLALGRSLEYVSIQAKLLVQEGVLVQRQLPPPDAADGGGYRYQGRPPTGLYLPEDAPAEYRHPKSRARRAAAAE